jgi:hypothetical protein
MDQASDSLKRLEAVVAGSATRGTAGENILARALGQLPPDLLEINVAFGNKIVEYALRLPGGRYLRARLRGDPPGVYEQIGPTFEELTRGRKPDISRPSLEHYRRYDEIDLLLPV